MSDLKKVFLVDLDNTLIDTEKFRDTFIEDAENFPFEKHFFPAYKNLLNILHSLGEVFIFSGGEEAFQMAKIKRAGIDQIIDQEHLIIVADKTPSLDTIIPRFKDRAITFIDDRADYLNIALKINPEIKCIWVRHGKYKDNEIGSEKFELIANSLEQILDYFFPYQIKKGLSEKQIEELLQYTKDDPDVQKFTSDPVRFKDRKSFDKWLKKGREIYTLSDSGDNLMGIIWFAKEIFEGFKTNQHYSPDKYPYTFAIRMYASARGKGLAKYFMDFCFADFGKKGIWLTTSADNAPAVKLYTNFGFKQIPDTNPYNKIVMVYE
ncbi:MAG: GNAT family N-acetyltransferase [Candidatus Daviesbacteria bacterium]|nr:GNAT family N-acetyltransferase [Candidatus Daviesbacteria bacterium]